MMSSWDKRRRYAVGAGLLIVGAGALAWSLGGLPGDTPAPVPEPSAVPSPNLAFATVKTVEVARRPLSAMLEVVGSVAYDQEHYAIVGPLVSGRVASLSARIGSKVQKNEILAEVESPEVGRARSAYVAAKARAAASTANLHREQELTQKHISSERELEVAEAQAVQEAAALDAAKEMLRALSLTPTAEVEGQGGRVPLRAPLSGTVVARDVALGQSVEHGTDAFIIADLSHLWVLLDIYEKDLERISVGQSVELRTESLPGRVMPGRVAYVEMRVDKQSRTANVRVEFDNQARLLRPGQFVTARLKGHESAGAAALVVPRQAVQQVDGKALVFVRAGDGFVPRPVMLGSSDANDVEVIEGLTEGEVVASEGSFLLKSQMDH